MNLSVLQNFDRLIKHPFPHIVIENCLPEDVYRELEETYPIEQITDSPPGANNTWLRKMRHMDVANIWKEFSDVHMSAEHFWKCLEILECDVPDGTVGYRREGDFDYVTDCQYAVQAPVTGTTRTPHIDSAEEIYASLLYMRPPVDTDKGGDFVIRTGDGTMVGKREVPNSDQFKVIPYAANTFVMFLNVRNSFHSVTPRRKPKHFRRCVNIIGEFTHDRMW